MATEFKKLSEVTALEEAAETAYVLIEENGEIYRVPKTAVGGAGGIKTAIIRDSGYLNAIAGLSTMSSSAPAYTYECINMTFEEAYETMANGEPLNVIGMLTAEGGMNVQGMSGFLGTAMGTPCIMVGFEIANIYLYWTANGLSASSPSQPK
jgi:hypothetical protein